MSTTLTPQEAGAIARQAFIYGYPMVEHYGLMYSQTIAGPMGFNQMQSQARLYGPEDQEVVTPNNDTAYSMAWVDLSAGAVTLQVGPVTTPPSEPRRYWSFQIIDYFTNNAAYIGLRATGPADSPQTFLLVGPDWNEEPPADVQEVIRCQSRIMYLIGRTQVFNAQDLPEVEVIQAGYVLTAGPVTKPSCVPYDPDLKMTLAFFSYMNQGFAFQAPPASDTDLMNEFAKINVGPGQTFDPDSFSAEVRTAMLEGMLNAKASIEEDSRNVGLIVGGWNMPRVDQEYFGTTLEAYQFRAAIAYKGIYANSPIEALYPIANLDGNGNQLTGANGRSFMLYFKTLPPVAFFWSLTMYYARTQFLVPNEIHRYSISNRTPGALMNPNGSFTVWVQYSKPSGDAELNWLPCPDEPFYVVLRMYGPEGEALEGEFGSYVVPPLRASE